MAKRILIADDSVTIQKAFAMTFAAEDVTLMPARSADEGLSLARQMRPDLVIADGHMPGRSGYDLCAAIKAEPSLRGTLVYILSSAQQPYDESKGRQVGVDGFLVKPFETTALIEKIRDAVPKAAPATVEAPSRAPAPPAARAPVRPPAADDDYGEISVDAPPRAPAAAAVPAYAAPAMRPAAMAPGAASPASGAGVSGGPAMRPSLIPGLRPGAIPVARPGSLPPARTAGPGAAPAAHRPPAGRTLMGLPAANIPIPGSMRPAAPAAHPGAMPQARPTILPATRPATVPSTHGPTSPLAPPPASSPSGAGNGPSLESRIEAKIDARVSALAAKGPEYEALAKLSREVIEQVVWEIVPELAEAIIREHLEKRGRL